MQTLRKQQGITFISLVLLFIIFGFFAMLALKLIPIYLDHYTINSIMESLQQEPMVHEKNPRQIRDTLKKRFKINGIYKFDMDSIQIKKTPKKYDLTIAFETREPVMGNVDIVVSFDKSVDLYRRP